MATIILTGLQGCNKTDSNEVNRIDGSKIKIDSNEIAFEPLEMVLVEEGEFEMGCDKGFFPKCVASNPSHCVYLGEFQIGKYEITQQIWKEIAPEYTPLYNFGQGENLPAYRISWYDAITFCNRLSQKEGYIPCYYFDDQYTEPFDSLIGGEEDIYIEVYWKLDADGYRLPTEAEWEYAAAGGSKSKGYDFSGSDDPEEVACWNIESRLYKTGPPVATKKTNELGIYDMSGNISEMCWDWYGNDYYKNSATCMPLGPKSGEYRVRRGGAWYRNEILVYIKGRGYNFPGNRSHFSGFRIARGKVNADNCP